MPGGDSVVVFLRPGDGFVVYAAWRNVLRLRAHLPVSKRRRTVPAL